MRNTRLLNDSIKFDKKITCYFIGNPDPDSIDSILENFRKIISQEISNSVTSKSGSTSEPRNAMKEVENTFYKKENNYTRSIVEIYANTNC